MNVEGIGLGSVVAQAAKAKPHKESSEVEVPKPNVVEAPESEGSAKGVLRLLQEGHFKGVADVRLRINFFDELQAMENQQVKDTAGPGFETFNTVIEGSLAAMEESGELNEDQQEAIEAFRGKMQEIQDGFLEGDDVSLQNLLDSLQAEFNALVASFAPPAEPDIEEPVIETEPELMTETVTEPQDEEPAAEEPILEIESEIPAEPMDEPLVLNTMETPTIFGAEPVEEIPQNTLGDLFTAFQTSFQQALEDLQISLSGASVLPEISQPSGNGKAFEKFMAIYEAMKNGGSSEPTVIDQLEPAE